jgi:hypothetical protein
LFIQKHIIQSSSIFSLQPPPIVSSSTSPSSVQSEIESNPSSLPPLSNLTFQQSSFHFASSSISPSVQSEIKSNPSPHSKLSRLSIIQTQSQKRKAAVDLDIISPSRKKPKK